MDAAERLVIAIGGLFLAGLAVEAIGGRAHIPKVSLLILLGVAAGPAGLDLLPPALAGTEGMLPAIALTMVAFLLGGEVSTSFARGGGGGQLLVIAAVVVVTSLAVVAGGLLLVGVSPALAVALGGLAGATDPAATREVTREADVDTAFSRRLLGVVAIDDAWGVLAFSLAMAGAGLLTGAPALDALLHGLWEIFGALGLGALLGLPAAHLTGRLQPGEPTLLEALGVVFLAAGLALAADVSLLLAGMSCGAVIARQARHHEQPFHEIERIEWPFMLLFFVMAGAALEVSALAAAGGLGGAYIALRALSRLGGGWLAGRVLALRPREGPLTGLALMPQAGVAIGMALVAAERLPAQSEAILAVAIGSTVVFEVAGPFATKVALARSARLDTPAL